MNDTINNKQSTEDGRAVGKPAVRRRASVHVRCKVCGYRGTGRLPKGGDGSFLYPPKHTRVRGGFLCGGVYLIAPIRRDVLK